MPTDPPIGPIRTPDVYPLVRLNAMNSDRYTFTVQINDGHCIHEYAYAAPSNLSIDDIAEALAEKLDCEFAHLRLVEPTKYLT